MVIAMASKKKSSTGGPLGSLTTTERSIIINQLRDKYIRGSSVTPFSERKNDRVSSNSRMTPNDWKPVQAESPNKKPNFRDIVLRAAQHKPFRENLGVQSQRRLSGLGHHARLHRFRQVVSQWRAKAKKTTSVKETLPEIDFEMDLPEKPRFCATLSTEAQYAIFKGYEDALVDKISSSLSKSDKDIPIKRVPSANIKIKALKERTSPFAILDTDKPRIIQVASLEESDEHFSEIDGEDRSQRDNNLRYMSAHYTQAMNLLDELKQNSCIVTEIDETDVKKPAMTIKRNIKQFNAWSQKWTKHFDFSC